MKERHESQHRKQTFGRVNIVFKDPLEQQWRAIQKQEQTRREQLYPLNKELHSHTGDENLPIYPKRRGHDPWAEQYKIPWLDPIPRTRQEINKEAKALRDMG